MHGSRLKPRWLRRRPALAAGLVVLAVALWSGTAAAIDTVSTGFDEFADGQIVTTHVPGVVFPNSPVVFTPANGRTASPPRALRHPLSCADSACSNGAYRLEIRFDRLARAVSLKAGDVLVGCFEFDCPRARLVGYDSAGNLVVDSGSKPIPSSADQMQTGIRIDEEFSIDAGAFTLARAVLYVGEDDVGGEEFGEPRTAQIDDLAVTMLSEAEPPPPPPPEPPAPTIDITSPAGGAQLPTPETTVSGTLTAPAGVGAFCVVANFEGPDLPPSCPHAPHLQETGDPGDFEFDLLIRGLRSGPNQLRAWVRDGRGRVQSDTVLVDVLSPEDAIDLLPLNIDVTQGIQVIRQNFPRPGGELPGVLGRARVQAYPEIFPPDPGSGEGFFYRSLASGVRLVDSKTTVVRVQAGASSTGRVGRDEIKNVTAILRGYRVHRGRPVLLGRLTAGPLDLESTSTEFTQRADPSKSFTFTLPPSWTHGEIFLFAGVNPASLSPRIPECPSCSRNNALVMSGVRFAESRRPRTITPIMLFTPTAMPPAPGQVFQVLRRMTPFPVGVRPYRAAIDISGLTTRFTGSRLTDELIDIVEDFEDEIEVVSERHKVIGITQGFIAGRAQSDIDAVGFDVRESVAVADSNRPMTSVAHEAYHMFGLEHAGRRPDCYTGQRNQRPDLDWPDSDNGGDILGWGLDPSLGSGGVAQIPAAFRGPFWVFGSSTTSFTFQPPAALPQAARPWDLMSYCLGATLPNGDSSDPTVRDAWISTISWNLLAYALRSTHHADRLESQANRSGRRPRTLSVAGSVAPDGSVTIDRVEPGPGTPDGSAPGATHTVVARNGAGNVISSVGVRPLLPDDAPDGSAAGFSTELRARGAALVQVVAGGAVLAERRRSANRPRVRVRRPVRGSKVPGRGFATIRWSASDRDRDRLTFDVDYSRNGGRTWLPVVIGARGRSARLPARLLGASARARIRVRANDGFNEVTGRSPRFIATGRAPEVTIFSLPRRARIDGNDLVALEGQAYDDRGRPIRGSGLRWLAGGRTVARGERATVHAGLLARRLILRATDYRGRTGRAAATLRIRRPKPLFLNLTAGRLGPRSRRLRLRVASTVPARVTISGRGVRRISRPVSKKPRRVLVPVTAGRRALRLRVRLVADGKATTVFLSVRRGR